MPFSPSLFTRHVSSAIAQRGRGYRNRVRVMKQKAGFIEAYVFGTHRYTTSISHIGDEYEDACTCPYGATCKHTIALAYVIAASTQLLALIEQINPNNHTQTERVPRGIDKDDKTFDSIRSYPRFEDMYEAIRRFDHKQRMQKGASSPKTVLDVLGAITAPVPQPESHARKKDHRAYYVLFTKKERSWGEDQGKTLLGLEAGKAERSDPSQPYRLNDPQSIRSMLGRNPVYLTPIDRSILRVASNAYEFSPEPDHWNAVPVEDESAHELIRRLAAAPIVFFHDGKTHSPLNIIAEPVKLQFQLEPYDQGWMLKPPLIFHTVYDYDPPIAITADRKLYVLETTMSARHITELINAPPIPTEAMHKPQTIAVLLDASRTVPIIFPSSWEAQAVAGHPTPVVTIHANADPWTVSLTFSYDGTRVQPENASPLLPRNDANHPIGRRNFEEERVAIASLSQALGTHPDSHHRWEIMALTCPQLFTDVVPAIPDDWEVFLEQESLTPIVKKPLSFAIETKSDTDWLDIAGTVTVGKETIALAELMDNALEGNTLIKLRDRYHLMPEALKRALHALRPLAQQSDGSVRVHRTQIGMLDDFSDLIDHQTLHPQWKQTIAAVGNFDGIKKVSLPDGLRTILRPYQRDGVDFLSCMRELGFGAILADDMGLGKTVQAIAMLSLSRQTANKPSLVVCPTSVINVWQQELSHFAPDLRVVIYAGHDRRLPKSSRTADIIITSYPLLWRDIKRLESASYHYVILDESQYIKNHDSQTAKAARCLRADHRLSLTGTPMENNTRELFSQFAFLNPGLFAHAEEFKEQFAVPIERDHDAVARERLRKLITPFLLRRTKNQVLTDLPAKIEQTRTLTMDTSQRAMYETVKAHYQAKILRLVDEQGMAKSHIQILEALLRLRQVCCDPTLLHFKERAPWLPSRLHTTESVKRTEVMMLLKEALSEGHSVLLFSQFVQMLEILQTSCAQEGLTTMMLTGQTKNRGTLVRDFQTNGKPTVFLISLKAGGTGLTLTAADYVIHYDPWWNPAVEVQATDRTHRIGQTKPVNVYKLIVKDTVEEKIQALQEKKKGLIDDLITASSGPKRLTREDLAFLFS